MNLGARILYQYLHRPYHVDCLTAERLYQLLEEIELPKHSEFAVVQKLEKVERIVVLIRVCGEDDQQGYLCRLGIVPYGLTLHVDEIDESAEQLLNERGYATFV